VHCAAKQNNEAFEQHQTFSCCCENSQTHVRYSGARTFFWTGGEARKYKILVSFCSQIAKHLHSASASNFNGSRVLHILYSFNLNVGLGAKKRLAILRDLLPNNPFLGMFELKFCLKPSKLVQKYISVLKCSILAITLFKY